MSTHRVHFLNHLDKLETQLLLSPNLGQTEAAIVMELSGIARKLVEDGSPRGFRPKDIRPQFIWYNIDGERDD